MRFNSKGSSSSDSEKEQIHKVSGKRSDGQEKLYECTGCGYISGRKSNVARHYRRIHCELKKHKVCTCGGKFLTKGEYYRHYNKEHPNAKHSWYVITKKYKIGKVRIDEQKNSGLNKPYHKIIKMHEKKGVRSSSRLLTMYKKKTFVNQAFIDNESDSSEAPCFEPLEEKSSNKENSPVKAVCYIDDAKEEFSENRTNLYKSHIPEDNLDAHLSHLPLKKRFSNFTNRKCLGDLIHFTNNALGPTNSIKNLQIENLYNHEMQFPLRHENFNNNQMEVPLKNENFNNNKVQVPLKNENFNNNKMQIGLKNQNFKNKKMQDPLKNESFNNNEMQVPNQNLVTIDEMQRAFISQIDFDDLNAIINLKYLKESVH